MQVCTLAGAHAPEDDKESSAYLFSCCSSLCSHVCLPHFEACRADVIINRTFPNDQLAPDEKACICICPLGHRISLDANCLVDLRGDPLEGVAATRRRICSSLKGAYANQALASKELGVKGQYLSCVEVRIQQGALRLHRCLALELKVPWHAQAILREAAEALRQIPAAAARP